MPVERSPPRERSIPLSTVQTTKSKQCSTYSDNNVHVETRETMVKIREPTIPLSWSDQCKTPIALTANHHQLESPAIKTTLALYNYPQETAVTSCTTATGTHYSIITTSATALSSTTSTTSSTSAKPIHTPSTVIQTATRSAECSAPTTLIASSSPTTHNTRMQMQNEKKDFVQSQLKRNRDKQSPNKLELSNNNKKQKNKMQSSTQTTLQEYWLGNPASSNRFDLLDVDNEPNINEPESNPVEKDPGTQRAQKPPPIYVQNVENVCTLTNALNSLPNTKFEIKVLSRNEIKIQPKETTHYTKIIDLLKQKKTKFYTFRPKEQQGLRVFLRQMHHSTPIEDIKNELFELGHETTNIHNIQIKNASGIKQPLSLFSIELKLNENNKDIYSITHLLHCKISFEPPRQKRTIPQCANCQRYGHTKNYCMVDPVCVKCAGKHKTNMCKIKNKVETDQIKCAHCGKNHTANYRGCEIYKKLQIQRYPTLRKKEIHAAQEQSNNEHHQKNLGTNTNQTLIPGISYAQATLTKTLTNEFNNPNSTTSSNDDLTELKTMMKQLITQMATMMNIVSILVSKLDGRTK